MNKVKVEVGFTLEMILLCFISFFTIPEIETRSHACKVYTFMLNHIQPNIGILFMSYFFLFIMPHWNSTQFQSHMSSFHYF